MALKAFLHSGIIEAGCDEAGRGCLAGPVFAAAVILPGDYFHPMLNDSKQLSARKREMLRSEIENESIDYGVASCTPEEIDHYNILNASYMAMHRALDQLKTIPGHILVDGNRFKPYKKINNSCIVKGDGKFFSIAAASILAKTSRDEFMEKISNQYPEFGWARNKGYPTKEHREAIKKYGATEWHRKSFRLLDDQLSLNF